MPAVEFLFGPAAPGVTFTGFKIDADLPKPQASVTQTNDQISYAIHMPARSFTNDVMLLADIVQEMVRGLYPLTEQATPIALSEGCAVYGAITAVKQVFGEETLGSYLDALKENGFAYYDAFSYVAVLLTEDPEAIKKLRELKPFLYQVERADFAQVGISLDRKIEDILTYTFRQ
nr:hypothetical protein [Marinomonas ostreistagni]